MQKNIKRNVSQRTSKSKSKIDEARIEKLFEYYYDLGPDRSLVTLADRTGVSFESLKQWSDAFGWEEKITDRNKDLDRSFENPLSL